MYPVAVTSLLSVAEETRPEGAANTDSEPRFEGAATRRLGGKQLIPNRHHEGSQRDRRIGA